MASRYEELAQLAIKDSRGFYQELEACSDCAAIAVNCLAGFLQAPPGSVSFVGLDKDLNSTEETSSKPLLKLGLDTAWHFFVRIHLGAKNSSNFGIITLRMNIKPSGSGFALHFDREFFINPGQVTSFDPFLDYTYSSIVADYSKPLRTRRQQIGFANGA